MAERNPMTMFGAHDVRFYSRTTGESLAHLRVLGDVNSEFTAEVEKLMGGSSYFPWDTAIKSFGSSLKITAREYDGDIMSLLLGGTLTEYASDSDGDIIDEANVKGTSVYGVATGILTVIPIPTTGPANLKEGWYLIKAASASTVNVYAYSNVDFTRGTDDTFEDEDGKITASPITITTSSNTDITDHGIRLTGGGGTIGMTTGDTARFYVQKIHGGAFEVKIGQSAMSFSDVGCVISMMEKDNITAFLHLYKVKVAGMAIGFPEKGFSTYDITVEPSYDSTLDAVGVFRRSNAA